MSFGRILQLLIATAAVADLHATQSAGLRAVLPFSLVNEHIVVAARVGPANSLSFLLDTGNKLAIVDLDRAVALGLGLGGAIRARGTSGSVDGRYVTGASYSLAGLNGFSAPLTIALPLRPLASRLGQDLDGLIGSDFIQNFVVEVDYDASIIRLHDPKTFHYTGTGRSEPITFNDQGHPVLKGTIAVTADQPISGSFVLDLGAGAAIELNAPFVSDHALQSNCKSTVRTIGFAGAGGDAAGLLCRLTRLSIAGFDLGDPIAFLSQDRQGTNAATLTQGRVGAGIAKRFRLFLDYPNRRIILEPGRSFSSPWRDATSGLVIEALGATYREFHVREVLEHSPGAEAGVRPGDWLLAIDETPTAQLSLTEILKRFRTPATYKLRVRTGDATRALVLRTRPLL